MVATESILPESKPDLTQRITRCCQALLANHGFDCLLELPLVNKRRADLAGLNNQGQVVIAEVKSCRADFCADHKWREYLSFADYFYFAVADDFPIDELLMPLVSTEGVGIIVTDGFGSDIVVAATVRNANASRRQRVIRQIAIAATRRLAGRDGISSGFSRHQTSLF